MSKNNIKRANRKYRKEHRRKKVRAVKAMEREATRTRNKKMRKLFFAGMKEDKKIRQKGREYVQDLEKEIAQE